MDAVQNNAMMDEYWPGPLMSAGLAIPHKVRSEFPMLERVRYGSVAYVDELQLLVDDEVARLLTELRRICRFCRREEFVHGVNGSQVFDRWRIRNADGELYASDGMNDFFDKTEALLERAAQHEWAVRLML